MNAILLRILALVTLLLPLNLHAASYIAAGEKITITIKGVPTTEQAAINGEYVVSDKGLIRLPYLKIGVKASGRSSSQVERTIEAAYREAEIYKNPRITIVTTRDEAEARTIAQKMVTVAGYVKRPGPVPYTQGMTIYQAVAAAGDANEFGAMNRVELLRGGQKMILNLKTTAARNVKVLVNDTITVPQKNWRGQ